MRRTRPHPILQEVVVGFFGALARYSISHPRRVLIIAALVSLAAIPGLPRLKLRTDGQALISPKAPEVVYDQKLRDAFGIEDQIVVLIRSPHPDGIFNPDTVQLVRDLTAELAKVPGTNPTNLMSLATEPSFHLRPGTLIHEKLLEPALKTKPELDRLREDLRRIELYTGTLVSADGKSTCILVAAAGQNRTELYGRIRQVIAAKQRSGIPEELAVTGAPVAESLLGIHILEDLGVPSALLGATTRSAAETSQWKWPGTVYELRLLIARKIGLLPVAIVVMMLVFYLSFRNVPATLLPLPGVVATMVFVFGLMGWCGVPIYLTLAVMPILLTATGVTNDIYIFSRYFTLLRENSLASSSSSFSSSSSKPEDQDEDEDEEETKAARSARGHVLLVRETFAKMVSPVASTSLTTGIGFLSFGLSPLGPVRAFGLCTGIGVLFGLLYSCTAVPALLALVNPAWLMPRRAKRGRDTPVAGVTPAPLANWFAGLGLGVLRWRWWIAGIACVTTAVTPLGLRRLTVQDSWMDAFDPSSEFRRVSRLVNEQFHGMHLLLVSCDAPQLLRGQVGATNLTRSEIILPGGLVDDAAVVAGSALTLEVDGPSQGVSTPGARWQSHLEMVDRRGQQIVARIAPGAVSSNFWPQLSKTGQARFELVARNHLRPGLIRTLKDLAGFIRERQRYAVGGVLGPAEYLETTRFMARHNDPTGRKLPENAVETKLMWDYYRLARGPARLRQVVDTNYWESLTTIFLKDANFVGTAKLMEDIRKYERDHLTAKGIKVGFAGDVALSQSLIAGIVSTQLWSLAFSVLGICAITAVLGGSVRWGFYCVLPSLLAVVMKLAIMGWFGIPLGVATSMFAAMTLGIGVNCSIQLLEGYCQALAAGATRDDALSHALRLTGPPALVNTLAVSLGFGVLMLSQVPANARLGLLVVLGLVECFVASLLLLPVLLHWWPLRKSASSRACRSPFLPA